MVQRICKRELKALFIKRYRKAIINYQVRIMPYDRTESQIALLNSLSTDLGLYIGFPTDPDCPNLEFLA